MLDAKTAMAFTYVGFEDLFQTPWTKVGIWIRILHSLYIP